MTEPDVPPSDLPGDNYRVEEVVVSSIRLIRRKPKILVPEIIATLIFVPLVLIEPESIENITANLTLVAGTFILAIIALPVIQGMYPLMAKNVMEGREVELSDAFRKSLRKFPTLIGGFVVLGLLIAIGPSLFGAGAALLAFGTLPFPVGLLLIVLGSAGIFFSVLFLFWFAYLIPAIMIENLGIRTGFSASKRFGRTVKLKTFLVLLIIGIIGAIGGILEIIPIVGPVIGAIVSLIVAAWASTAISYAYIKHGMAEPPSS